HAKATVTAPEYQPAALGFVVGPPVSTGAVRSILKPPLNAFVTLPALSATDTSPVPRSTPSPFTTLSAGAVAMPESRSSASHSTVTSPLYQPAALGAVVAAPVSVGAVLSILMPLTAADALLPATSVAVPATSWPEPSFSSVVAGEQAAMPEWASEHVKDTT